MSIKKVNNWILCNFSCFTGLKNNTNGRGQIPSLVNKTIEDWMATKATWKNNSSWNLFLCSTEELELKFFLNTTLAFAAMERVFVGSDVMKPKRATLSSENFERLVFIRENENCVLPLK